MGTIITASRRVFRGAHKFRFNKHSGNPLAPRSPAGFLFLPASRIVLPIANPTREGIAVKIAFEKQNGLVPAIIQDHSSGEVLMLGFMNEAALAETNAPSRRFSSAARRNKLWRKGESSGHILRVREMRIDCDADAILVRVEPLGPGVCHEGYRSCFFRQLNADGLAPIVEDRTFEPEKIYGQARQIMKQLKLGFLKAACRTPPSTYSHAPVGASL